MHLVGTVSHISVAAISAGTAPSPRTVGRTLNRWLSASITPCALAVESHEWGMTETAWLTSFVFPSVAFVFVAVLLAAASTVLEVFAGRALRRWWWRRLAVMSLFVSQQQQRNYSFSIRLVLNVLGWIRVRVNSGVISGQDHNDTQKCNFHCRPHGWKERWLDHCTDLVQVSAFSAADLVFIRSMRFRLNSDGGQFYLNKTGQQEILLS